MMIDAHQHYWRLDRGDYGWLTPASGPILFQDYMPDLLKDELHNGVQGTIVVQAAPTMEETAFLLDLCDKEETLIGVVGWLDINASDFEKHYLRFRSHPRFVGIRPNFPDFTDGEWGQHKQLIHNLSILAEDDCPVDLLVRPPALAGMVKLLGHVPNLSAVVDHLGKPDLSGENYQLWANGMRSIAKFERTSCKVSGLATEGPFGDLKPTQVIQPYIQHVIQEFGSSRLMFGSDWPICLQAGSFTEMRSMIEEALSMSLSADEIDHVFGHNAVRIYDLR
ncbi:amidohydrolase family protein [Paenibacillus sp. KQZ6P-2]|uniref:Amidohydrolase family protein n=1 Tax=Paenibacillus mangrovi TaxID=2931978 RepID=A0A9X2B4M6_9BACL|nr:amidohydrolase family protein [Paenibacillus mangrovi]MCJ8011807.1 amidohydrolase family protein [Paenibacillus mangrovi]